MCTEIEIIKKANQLLDERETEEALIYLEENSRKYPSMKVLNNMGWFYTYIGIFKEDTGLWYYSPERAIEPLKQAISLSTESHYPYTNLGCAYYKLENYEEAAIAFQNSVDIEKSVINQNNLVCSLMKLKKFNEANTIMNELLKDVKNADVFEFFLKCKHSPEHMSLYSILFNYAVIQAELGNISNVKSTAEQLLEYHNLNYISMDDVDIIDILMLFNFCGEHETVIKLYPQEGYAVDENVFSLYLSSLLKLGLTDKAEEFYKKTIADIDEEIQDFSEDEECEDKEFLIDKCKKHIEIINDTYNQFLKNPKMKLNFEPKIMYSNYYFR